MSRPRYRISLSREDKYLNNLHCNPGQVYRWIVLTTTVGLCWIGSRVNVSREDHLGLGYCREKGAERKTQPRVEGSKPCHIRTRIPFHSCLHTGCADVWHAKSAENLASEACGVDFSFSTSKVGTHVGRNGSNALLAYC